MRRFHILCVAVAISVAVAADQNTLDLDELGYYLLKGTTGCVPDDSVDNAEIVGFERAKMGPVGRFADHCGISTNEARDAIYDLLMRDWRNAAMYYGEEYIELRRLPRPNARSAALARSDRLERMAWYADLVYTESKREELRHMALVSSNSAIRAEGLRMTLESPALSTNSLYEIHDALASAPLCAWTFQTIDPLSTEDYLVRVYPANSNLLQKSVRDPDFKDRLNRLDWFVADMLPSHSDSFDERLAASVCGYSTSIQRLNLYQKIREADFSAGKTNLWNKYSQPILDRLNAIPTNELNDVSAALSWQ